jgi:hypothetical protein
MSCLFFVEQVQGRKRPYQASPGLGGRHLGGGGGGGEQQQVPLTTTPWTSDSYTRSPHTHRPHIPQHLPLSTFSSPNNKNNRLTPTPPHQPGAHGGDSSYVVVASPTLRNLQKCTRTCCNSNNGGRDADDDAPLDDKASDGDSTTTSGSYMVDPDTQSVATAVQIFPQTAATSVA